MYIRRTKPSRKVNPAKGTYYAIYESVWNPDKKRADQHKIQALGYAADIIAAGHPNPDAYAGECLAALESNRKSDLVLLTLDYGKTICSDFEEADSTVKSNQEFENYFNVGYAIPRRIYKSLSIDRFLKLRSASRSFEYDADKVFRLLTFARLIDPASKRRTWLNRGQFFEDFSDISLDDVYSCLDFIADVSEDLQYWIYKHLGDLYTPDTSRGLFDCTNYYFDISGPYIDTFDEYGNVVDDEGNPAEPHYQKRGPEKNHRPDPIVEMGLLLDANAFPLGFEMFPGNESEKTHMLPMLERIRTRYEMGRIIVIADRGLNTATNIYYLNGDNKADDNERDGYIYGQTVRGASKDFQEWVLSPGGWTTTEIARLDEDGLPTGETIQWRHKSRTEVRKLQVPVGGNDGKKHTKTVRIDQKQLTYYSEKYAKRQKRSRDEMVNRAKDLMEHPEKYNRVTASGSASYIKNIAFDKETGEIVSGRALELDKDKIAEEEKLDGYYSIVTSELKMSDEEIRNAYRQLIFIEHTFRILKDDLEARPIYVRQNSRIKGHFTVCYVALVLLRLLEEKLEHKFTVQQILRSLRKFCCSQLPNHTYHLTYFSQAMQSMENAFHVELNREYRSQMQMRRMIGY